MGFDHPFMWVVLDPESFYLSKKKKIEAEKMIRKEVKEILRVPVLLESSISKMPEIEEEDHLSPGGLQYPPR